MIRNPFRNQPGPSPENSHPKDSKNEFKAHFVSLENVEQYEDQVAVLEFVDEIIQIIKTKQTRSELLPDLNIRESDFGSGKFTIQLEGHHNDDSVQLQFESKSYGQDSYGKHTEVTIYITSKLFSSPICGIKTHLYEEVDKATQRRSTKTKVEQFVINGTPIVVTPNFRHEVESHSVLFDPKQEDYIPTDLSLKEFSKKRKMGYINYKLQPILKHIPNATGVQNTIDYMKRMFYNQSTEALVTHSPVKLTPKEWNDYLGVLIRRAYEHPDML